VAFDFHFDNEVYFEHLAATARDYILPYIAQDKPIRPGMRVLDIGCGTGGLLSAFIAKGCHVTGVDLRPASIQTALGRFPAEVAAGTARFWVKNIYDFDPAEERFDVILFKDSIEHIHGQEAIIRHVRQFLQPGGVVWFGFPPWAMPFGGHQQIIYQNRYLGRLPWYHLLPRAAYRHVLQEANLPPEYVAELVDIHDCGISTHRFERIARRAGYRVARRTLWFLNPIYRQKFGFGPIPQFGWLGSLPGIRDFFSTAAYYTLAPNT
jgi:SAM-dependent methyltransferase